MFSTLVLLTVSPSLAQKVTELKSPDGKTLFRLFVNNDGQMRYDISYSLKKVVELSSLGLDGWSDHLQLQSVQRKEQATSWKPVYGKRSLVHDRYRTNIFAFKPPAGVKAGPRRQMYRRA